MEGTGRRSAPTSAARAKAPAAGSPDQRFAPRRPGQLPAQIYFDGGVQGVACLIRDMSTTGAKLEVREGWDNQFTPAAGDRIRLVIRQDRVVYDCKITRRSETVIGVKFLAAPKPITKAAR